MQIIALSRKKRMEVWIKKYCLVQWSLFQSLSAIFATDGPVSKRAPFESKSFPCVLVLQEEISIPFDHVLIACRPALWGSAQAEEQAITPLDPKNDLKSTIQTLVQSPLELHWDHTSAFPSVCLLGEHPKMEKRETPYPARSDKNLCCFDPETIVRVWVPLKHLSEFFALIEATAPKGSKEKSLYQWKIEGCEAFEIQSAQQELRKKLLEKAYQESHGIAQLMDAKFIGFRQMNFTPASAANRRLQGGPFIEKEILFDQAPSQTKICPFHSINLTEKLECCFEIEPKSLE